MKKEKWFLLLLIIFISGCVTTEVPNVIESDEYISKNQISKDLPRTIEEAKKYFLNQPTLNKYEGIYENTDPSVSYIIAITKIDNVDYIGYILESSNKAFKPGDLKIEFRGVSGGVSAGTWYMADKSEKKMPFKFSGRLIEGITARSGFNWLKIFPLEEDKKNIGSGTAFSISENGYLLTAQHVIDGFKNIYIHINKKKMKASLIASDSNNDTALLKVDYTFKDHLNLHSTSLLSVGDKVFTTGYPITDLLGKEIKYTDGIISSKSGIQGVVSMMQTTVPVQPGNSGGALVSADSGNVVGLISSTASLAFYSISGSLPQNVNWAVKSDYIIPMISELDLVKSELLTENTIKRAINSSFIVECDNKENKQ